MRTVSNQIFQLLSCLDHSEQHPHFLTKLFLYTKRCCVTNQLRIILIPSFCVLSDCIIERRHIHRLAAPNHVADRSFQVVGMNQLMAGGGVALIGITLVPLLSGLFG